MNESNSNKNLLLSLIIMFHNEFVIYACCLSNYVLMITKCKGKIFTTLRSSQLIFVYLCVCMCVWVQKYGYKSIKASFYNKILWERGKEKNGDHVY